MPEGNPLVADAPQDGDGPGPLTAGNGDYGWAGGIGIAESAMDAFNGIQDGNWVEGGLGMLGLAAEGAAAAIDPFGWLMSSVASFLMEHVQPLKDMLDSVCGDPPVIQSYSETWGNVAKHLEEAQVTFANAVKNGTAGWTGEAADAYRKSCGEQEETIAGAATVAGAISTVVMIMGEVVAFVRETVRDLIADLVGKLISWVLETVCTLGFGTPVVVAQAVTAISKWATKIADLLKKLIETIRKVSPLLGKLADVFADIIKVCGKIAGKVTGLDVIDTKNIIPGGFLRRGDGPDIGGGSGGSGGGSGGGGGSGSGGDSPSGSGSDGQSGSDSGDAGSGEDAGSGSDLSGSDGGAPASSADPSSSGSPGPAGEGPQPRTGSDSGDRRGSSADGSDTGSANGADGGGSATHQDGRTSDGGGSGDGPRQSTQDGGRTAQSDGTPNQASQGSGPDRPGQGGPSPNGAHTANGGGSGGTQGGEPGRATPGQDAPSRAAQNNGWSPAGQGDAPSQAARNDGPSQAGQGDAPRQATQSDGAGQAGQGGAPNQGTGSGGPGQAAQGGAATHTTQDGAPGHDSQGGGTQGSASPSGTSTTQSPSSGGPHNQDAPHRPGSQQPDPVRSDPPSDTATSAATPSSTAPRADAGSAHVPSQRGVDGGPQNHGQPPTATGPAQSGPSTASPGSRAGSAGGRTGTPESPGSRPTGPGTRPGPDAGPPNRPGTGRPGNTDRPGPGHHGPADGRGPGSQDRSGSGSQGPTDRRGQPPADRLGPGSQGPTGRPGPAHHIGPGAQGAPGPHPGPGHRPGPGNGSGPGNGPAPHAAPRHQTGPGHGGRPPWPHGPSRSGPQGPGPQGPGRPAPGGPASPGPARPGPSGPGGHPGTGRPGSIGPAGTMPPAVPRGFAPDGASPQPSPPATGRPHGLEGPQQAGRQPSGDVTPDRAESADHGPQETPRPTTDEVNQRHAERTPSGTSFHRGDPDLGDLPHRVRPDPDGRYTVDVHVTPDGHARIGGHRYTPEEFADILRRNGDYDGRPIRLIGCDAGSNDFARRLARELDTEVLAPNKPAWTDSNGRVFSSDYEIGPDGKVRPKIPPNGEWDVHRPDGSTAGAGDHGFTPGTAGSDKDDLDADDARARGDDNGADDTDDTDTDTDAEDSGNPASGRTTSFDTDDWDEFELDEADPRFDERFVDFDRPGLGRSDAENPYHRPNETNGPPGKSPEETVMVEDAGRDHTPAGQHATPETIRRVPEYLERFLEGHPPKLRPHTEYPVVHTKDGHEVSRTRFYTDENGDIRWVELTPGTGPMPDGSGKKAPPNPDFDYPLLPETKYRVDNFNDPDKKWDFETDERGLTKYMTGEPEYRASNPMYRDEGGDYTAQGRAGEEGRQAYRNDPDHSDVHWAGGHFGANEAGGPPGYGNMHPQMRASNSGNNKDGWVASETWRTLERQLKKVDAMAGHDVELLQTASPRRGDGLAEEVTIRWRITEPGPDGESVTRVFERVFPVVPEKVYDDPSTVVRYA